MSIPADIQFDRVSRGAVGVPRWLTTPEGAVLISGPTAPRSSGGDQYDRTLRLTVLRHLGGGRLAAQTDQIFTDQPQLASGMLTHPDWDIAMAEDGPVRAVDCFGGATSEIGISPAHKPAYRIAPPGAGQSLAAPRFWRGWQANDATRLTAADGRNVTIWSVPVAEDSRPEPLGDGLRAVMVQTAKRDLLISTLPVRGGHSPLGDRAGQLHIAAIDPAKGFGGHRPLPGADHCRAYDFDAMPDADGRVYLLCAARTGLHLLRGDETGMETVIQVTHEPVLHPALQLADGAAHIAFNRVENNDLSHTLVTQIPLA